MTVRSPVRSPLGRQQNLPGLSPVADALKRLSQSGAEVRGAVFTRREVVDFILDLAGYVPERPLSEFSLLEPSFGEGDFLLVAVERLLKAWRGAGKARSLRQLSSCIRAVELHEATFDATRAKLVRQLCAAGIAHEDAETLSTQWLVRDDFLLATLPTEFDFVVGNPPYVRHELVPDALMAEYRALYPTIFDRADLYIPFIERSVRLLSAAGTLAIICADRWLKNRYGGPLRQLLSEDFQLHAYVDMVDTPAFHSDVIAYPAIFVIGREKTGATRIARRPEISATALTTLARQLARREQPKPDDAVQEVTGVGDGSHPWMLETSDRVALVRRLERDIPTIEEAGCRVGIGVATGADKAFIGPFEELDVEDDRKIPLATTRDILSGEVRWRGLGVVNPFDDSGALVDLARYPRLKGYLEARKDAITGRHVARKAPAKWYRTIDRIHPALATTPKLLIPDIKGEAHVVYEDGRLYPHHNLYFVTSEEWDLRALRAVLLSGIAKLFVSTYSTRMRGGYLRFQAQYLRRIRLPRWSTVPADLKEALVHAASKGDVRACNAAAFALYALTSDERAILSLESATR